MFSDLTDYSSEEQIDLNMSGFDWYTENGYWATVDNRFYVWKNNGVWESAKVVIHSSMRSMFTRQLEKI